MNAVKQIKELLSNRISGTIEDTDSSYVRAAVLIPLFTENSRFKVLFTQRTNKVENHKGQISFPGGVAEEVDKSLKETALRESYEEVGILKKDVEILGRVDETITSVSDFIVRPFVGLIPYPYPFKINPYEVKRIITVPLDLFFKQIPDHQKREMKFDDPAYDDPVYQYHGDTIWGATARIMENFIRIVGENLGLPEREE